MGCDAQFVMKYVLCILPVTVGKRSERKNKKDRVKELTDIVFGEKYILI